MRILLVLGVMLEPLPKTLVRDLKMSHLIQMGVLVMETLLTLLILLIPLTLPTLLGLLMILLRKTPLIPPMKTRTMMTGATKP